MSVTTTRTAATGSWRSGRKGATPLRGAVDTGAPGITLDIAAAAAGVNVTGHVASGGAGGAPGSVPSPAVVPARELVAAMVSLMGHVEDARAWSPAERREILRLLDRAVDGLTAARAAVLVAERDSEAWRGAGDRSFAAWRARVGRAGDRSAAAQVRQADQLAAVPPEVTAAVAEGRITAGHAATIGTLLGAGSPAQRAAAASPEGQAELLTYAQQQDARTFELTAARWAATEDPKALEADHQAQRRKRFLQLSHTPRGTFLNGRLDSMAGHRVALALEALTPRPAASDDRDAGQRCADALEAMAAKILSLVDTKPGAHVPPQVSFILTEETWAAARAESERRRTATAGDERAAPSRESLGDTSLTGEPSGPGEPLDGSTPTVGYPPATLEDGTPVPVSELARVLCDCALTRIVVDAAGTPVDLGRTQRLFSGEQRRAVIARDRECIWPGCHIPARWCEVHHVRWWVRDNGPTSVECGALLCVHHHQETHDRDLTITRVLIADDAGWPPGGAAVRPGSGGGRRRRGRHRSSTALVAYELRDPTGRLIGDRGGGGIIGAAGAGWPPGSGEPVASTADDLTWTTDPVTGMRISALWTET